MELLIPKFSGAWFLSILRWFVVRIVQSRPPPIFARHAFFPQQPCFVRRFGQKILLLKTHGIAETLASFAGGACPDAGFAACCASRRSASDARVALVMNCRRVTSIPCLRFDR